MKYLLFAGHNYYPLGGVDDVKGIFDTEQGAWNCLNQMTIEKFGRYTDEIQWFQIVLMDHTGLTVLQTDFGYTATAEGWCVA